MYLIWRGADVIFKNKHNQNLNDISTIKTIEKNVSVTAQEKDNKDDMSFESEASKIYKKPQNKIYIIIRLICTIGFIFFTGLLINEAIIQPIKIKKSIDLTRELYNEAVNINKLLKSPLPSLASTSVTTVSPTSIIIATPTPDPNRDAQGRLLQFKDLLALNEDVKGWLSITRTNIDYVVMQSRSDDPEFYLYNDINKKYSKAGSLFLDYRSSVENISQNMVIHGHNMVSTDEKMLHDILKYKPTKNKNIDFYKEHPIITFDTIYERASWKVFSVFITTPDISKKYFFEYRSANFKDSSDFLNFVYQLRIRSLLVIDSVDINEYDQLLMLSTCSYEVNHNYRTVIVARKVREGESLNVDVDSVIINKSPLYSDDYYKKYGGKAPKLTATFEEALAKGEIYWYIPLTE